MTYRARNIGLALALGLGAALLVTLYVHRSGSSTPSISKQIASVFVAGHDISAGTPGAEMGKMIHPQQVAKDTVVPGAISNKAQVAALVSTAPILAGQQVTLRQFQRVAQEGVAGEISRTMRVFQLAGDANQLLVDTLRQGDHVDVIANIKYSLSDFRSAAGAASANAQTGLVATRIVLRNLLVLQAPTAPAGSSKFGISSTYGVILRVTDNQAQKLFYVTKNSDWSLALRPLHAAADSPGSVETAGSILGDGLKAPQFSELLSGPGGPAR
jgi:Flp pilus assembly protein CpaB